MKRSPRCISVAVGSLALLVQSACGAAVVMDGGGGGAGGAGSTSGQGSPDGPDGPDDPESTTSSVAPSPTTSGGGGRRVSAIVFGDSTVTLRIATLALSCNDPDANPSYSPCSDWWDLELRMPESMLAVGEVDTASGDLTIFGTSSRADCKQHRGRQRRRQRGIRQAHHHGDRPDPRSPSELSDVGSVFVDDGPERPLRRGPVRPAVVPRPRGRIYGDWTGCSGCRCRWGACEASLSAPSRGSPPRPALVERPNGRRTEESGGGFTRSAQVLTWASPPEPASGRDRHLAAGQKATLPPGRHLRRRLRNSLSPSRHLRAAPNQAFGTPGSHHREGDSKTILSARAPPRRARLGRQTALHAQVATSAPPKRTLPPDRPPSSPASKRPLAGFLPSSTMLTLFVPSYPSPRTVTASSSF